MQRALFQQVSPCKPCVDPHMNLPEKGNARTGCNVQYDVGQINHNVCVCVCVDMLMCSPPPSSVSQHSPQLESGWREQGAGVLHASFYWRGDHASRPTEVLPTRYFLLLPHTQALWVARNIYSHFKLDAL